MSHGRRIEPHGVGPGDRPSFRRSPVTFNATPAETELRDGWTVVLRYQGEDDHPGPWLVDLSHRRRWDFQDRDIAAQTPMDLPVPLEYGQVGIHGPLVINRMNRTQVAIWHLGEDPPPPTPHATGLTETTDGHCKLAFVGPRGPRGTGTPHPPRPLRPGPPHPPPHPGAGAARPLPDRHLRGRPRGHDLRPRLRGDLRPCGPGVRPIQRPRSGRRTALR